MKQLLIYDVERREKIVVIEGVIKINPFKRRSFTIKRIGRSYRVVFVKGGDNNFNNNQDVNNKKVKLVDKSKVNSFIDDRVNSDLLREKNKVRAEHLRMLNLEEEIKQMHPVVLGVKEVEIEVSEGKKEVYVIVGHLTHTKREGAIYVGKDVEGRNMYYVQDTRIKVDRINYNEVREGLKIFEEKNMRQPLLKETQKNIANTLGVKNELETHEEFMWKLKDTVDKGWGIRD